LYLLNSTHFLSAALPGRIYTYRAAAALVSQVGKLVNHSSNTGFFIGNARARWGTFPPISMARRSKCVWYMHPIRTGGNVPLYAPHCSGLVAA
jgi:hypothetical protein